MAAVVRADMLYVRLPMATGVEPSPLGPCGHECIAPYLQGRDTGGIETCPQKMDKIGLCGCAAWFRIREKKMAQNRRKSRSWAAIITNSAQRSVIRRHTVCEVSHPPTATYQWDGGRSHLVCCVATDPSARRWEREVSVSFIRPPLNHRHGEFDP